MSHGKTRSQIEDAINGAAPKMNEDEMHRASLSATRVIGSHVDELRTETEAGFANVISRIDRQSKIAGGLVSTVGAAVLVAAILSALGK